MISGKINTYRQIHDLQRDYVSRFDKVYGLWEGSTTCWNNLRNDNHFSDRCTSTCVVRGFILFISSFEDTWRLNKRFHHFIIGQTLSSWIHIQRAPIFTNIRRYFGPISSRIRGLLGCPWPVKLWMLWLTFAHDIWNMDAYGMVGSDFTWSWDIWSRYTDLNSDEWIWSFTQSYDLFMMITSDIIQLLSSCRRIPVCCPRFVKHTKTGNPLVDSVAEHQPALISTFWHQNMWIALTMWIAVQNYGKTIG